MYYMTTPNSNLRHLRHLRYPKVPRVSIYTLPYNPEYLVAPRKQRVTTVLHSNTGRVTVQKPCYVSSADLAQQPGEFLAGT